MKNIRIFLLILISITWLNAALNGGRIYPVESFKDNSCTWNYNKEIELNPILYHYFYNKTCENIKEEDLKENAIIDTYSDISQVMFLNNISNLDQEGKNIYSCCVTRKYKSHFDKGLEDKKTKVKLVDLKESDQSIIYKFNTKCIDITKQDLLDNNIVREFEDNRNLRYFEIKEKDGNNYTYKNICDIIKLK